MTAYKINLVYTAQNYDTIYSLIFPILEPNKMFLQSITLGNITENYYIAVVIERKELLPLHQQQNFI